MKPIMTRVSGPHPAMLDDPTLRGQCRETFGRASGPGGQHRNKVETAVRITHVPSGIEATAAERRSQAQNRHTARQRLRIKLAVRLRTVIKRGRYRPTALWIQRRQGSKLPVNPTHRDFPALLAEAMDVVAATNFDVAGAAGILGITMSQVVKLVGREPKALAWVNEGRAALGLPVLK
jgi:hypothetical protein